MGTLVILNFFLFFFFNDTATTEIYTLSLHDALPISRRPEECTAKATISALEWTWPRDRKSTRLNSSHSQISYAVFCLKKKKLKKIINKPQPNHTHRHQSFCTTKDK